VLPADVTFAPADFGSHVFVNGVRLKSIGTQKISATDTLVGSLDGSAAILIAPQGPTKFVVTNTLDSGTGSLRQAMLDSNLHAAKDTIAFKIGSGERTILVGANGLGALPAITDPVVIDASSQPGFAGKPIIEVSGTKLGAGNSASDGKNGFGILIEGGATDNVAQGNLIGTDASGANPLPNFIGVQVSVAEGNNTIGGSAAGAGNVISGNTAEGINLLADDVGGIHHHSGVDLWPGWQVVRH
jgi:hypothetical protein